MSMDRTASAQLVQNRGNRATTARGCTRQTSHLSDVSDEAVEVAALSNNVMIDTVVHDILPDVLSCWFNITDTAFSWFQSYLGGRTNNGLYFMTHDPRDHQSVDP